MICGSLRKDGGKVIQVQNGSNPQTLFHSTFHTSQLALTPPPLARGGGREASEHARKCQGRRESNPSPKRFEPATVIPFYLPQGAVELGLLDALRETTFPIGSAMRMAA